MMLSSKINSNKEAINIQMLTAGIYIVQVVDALGNVTNKRLVVAQ